MRLDFKNDDVIQKIYKYRKENNIKEKFNHFIPELLKADAVAFNNTIYYKSSKANTPMSLKIHETVHLMQFKESGIAGFLFKYFLEYLAGMLSGKSRYEAYRSISFEVEAFNIEELFNSYIKGDDS
jgi:hypothetical protein